MFEIANLFAQDKKKILNFEINFFYDKEQKSPRVTRLCGETRMTEFSYCEKISNRTIK